MNGRAHRDAQIGFAPFWIGRRRRRGRFFGHVIVASQLFCPHFRQELARDGIGIRLRFRNQTSPQRPIMHAAEFRLTRHASLGKGRHVDEPGSQGRFERLARPTIVGRVEIQVCLDIASHRIDGGHRLFVGRQKSAHRFAFLRQRIGADVQRLWNIIHTRIINEDAIPQQRGGSGIRFR